MRRIGLLGAGAHGSGGGLRRDTKGSPPDSKTLPQQPAALFDYAPEETLRDDVAYDRMVARFGKLADKMASEGLRAGPDLDNDALPAGYTYLGQMIMHDLTRSRPFALDKASMGTPVINLHSPALDLDSIYGSGPELSPMLYATTSRTRGHNRYALRIGRLAPAGNGHAATPNGAAGDIPRALVCPFGDGDLGSAAVYEPIIADPRNEDNLVLSQLVVLFHRFHNIVAAKVVASGEYPFDDVFRPARSIVEIVWRSIVRQDFMPRLLGGGINAICQRLIERRQADDAMPPHFAELPSRVRAGSFRIPVEASLAGLRFGHSMVRSAYKVNDVFDLSSSAPPSALQDLMEFSGLERSQHLPMTDDWVVDWRRFFEMEPDDAIGAFATINPALRIRPAVNGQLAGTGKDDIENRVILRTLVRGYLARLPTGQALAARLGIRNALNDCEIRSYLSRPNNPSQPFAELDPGEIDELSARTPLFFYVLCEADAREGGMRLGPLGSTLLGLTLAGALLSTDPAADAAAALLAVKLGLTLPSTLPDLARLVGNLQMQPV